MVAGILGVVIGSVMGQKLRVKYPTADPVICGVGLLLSTPLIYGTMILARGPEIPTYVIFFFGQWLLNLNWAITGDIMVVMASAPDKFEDVKLDNFGFQYVIFPTRRATAKAIQLVFNHVLGDAASPFVIGLVIISTKMIEITRQPPSRSQMPSTNSSKRTVSVTAR